MADRRPLVEGLKATTPPANPEREREFVYGTGSAAAQRAQSSIPREAPRSPVSTRIRADLATALKHASLERQLKGVEPYTVQEILEEAIESWLRTNGR